MKNLFNKIFLALTAVILISSCDSILDVEQKMELNSNSALNSTFGLSNAILGAYDRLQSGDLYGGNIWTGGEMLAGNIKKSGEGNIVYEETQMLEKNLSADNRITASMWSNAYYTINLVNNVLEAIPNVTDADIDAEKDRIRGEALFIRALLHFDLVRYFGNHANGYNDGLGVPVLTSPSGIDAQPARATMDEVYQQVISDLKEAFQLLPGSNNDRATNYSAAALLARVAFYYQDWDIADSFSSYVINSGKFSLIDSMPLNYTEKISKEIIFAIMSYENDYSCGTLNTYYRNASGAKFSPSTDLIRYISSEGKTDKRFSHFTANIDGKFYTTKFDNRYMNVPLIRFSEMYLIRAEARFNKGDNTRALDDLNVVRLRAGLKAYTSINLTYLYSERTKELTYEGDNFFNKKRLGMKISGLDWNDRKLVYLIPQREIDVNPNLVQN